MWSSTYIRIFKLSIAYLLASEWGISSVTCIQNEISSISWSRRNFMWPLVLERKFMYLLALQRRFMYPLVLESNLVSLVFEWNFTWVYKFSVDVWFLFRYVVLFNLIVIISYTENFVQNTSPDFLCIFSVCSALYLVCVTYPCSKLIWMIIRGVSESSLTR
jgi:hypothetical protein